MQAPNELIVKDLVNHGNLNKYKTEIKSLKPLSLNELIAVAQKFPKMTIAKLN